MKGYSTDFTSVTVMTRSILLAFGPSVSYSSKLLWALVLESKLASLLHRCCYGLGPFVRVRYSGIDRLAKSFSNSFGRQ